MIQMTPLHPLCVKGAPPCRQSAQIEPYNDLARLMSAEGNYALCLFRHLLAFMPMQPCQIVQPQETPNSPAGSWQLSAVTHESHRVILCKRNL